MMASVYSANNFFRSPGVPGNDMAFMSGIFTPHTTVKDSPVMNSSRQTLDPIRLKFFMHFGSIVMGPRRIFMVSFRREVRFHSVMKHGPLEYL